jgi:hypothetical protein
MKKIALLLMIAAASPLFFAQTHFGVKAGYTNSTLDWKDSPDTYWADYSDFKSNSFFYVGGFAEHFLSKKFALQCELLFTQVGGKTTVDLYTFLPSNEWVPAGTIDGKLKYTQIQVPISAKYYFIDKFALSGGLNFAFNISTKADFDMLGSGKIENARTLNVNPFLGAEYHITQTIFADARYNFGFAYVNKDGIDMKSQFFQIGLGYRFK